MKGQGIKNFFDKHRPKFEKGGKLHPFQSVFEGFETFMYVPDATTKKGSHVRDYIDLKRTMIFVVLAVVPTMLFGMYNIGYQHYHAIGEFAQTSFWQVFIYGLIRVLPVIVVSYVVGLAIEFTFAQIKGHEINEGYLVSGILIPLVLPIDTPLWMVAIAVAFSVIIAKEAFGGTGMNIWNPALIARAFLFFAYPSHMSGDSVWVRIGADADKVVDGFSGATPLGMALTGNIDYNIWDAFWGFIPGSIGETSTFAILLGAAFLLITGIGSWRIMLSTVLGALFTGLIINAFAVNPFMEIPFWHHLFLGGFAFGAVFMATDPVSAAQTPAGKWIYGFLIGVMAIVIRVLNPAYPEGVMLAILLMNTFAPLIDHYVVQANVKKRLKRAAANV
ncbi:MAG: NADH:ubiquinone reductase (Na(+)-transporting) subunit B [Prolixibacteraceae bacterium]|nr:NADH:ubiquinone reductase (Na(+)-transporting) subunit B [Prolixibacteraceae bacterium]MBN2648629.1 NADH:ubiquinone reductase (Na(+)-transporting) subunit B [Prolixibacteraceae bacterium]